MLGPLETVIGIIVALIAFAFLGPKAYWKIKKAIAYGKVLDKYAEKKIRELEKKIESGEIDESKLLEEIEKEIS